ncbi:MAG: putative baseplate assembly protein, partial [Candidatus Kapaibacterium sp.]
MINSSTPDCTIEERRGKVREQGLNGIDYLEVSDDQRTLTVYFLGKAPTYIDRRNVVISGGRRITGINVIDLSLCILVDEDRDDCMKVVVDRPGDFSTYTLCVVETDESGRPTGKPLQGFDPRYSCVEFSFKVGCPSDLDCLPTPCPPVALEEPEIDYLAKDYASFRRLMLDRLALIMPDWRERHIPDIGITLVELLAYVGDHLSYYQDAVATEAYLGTARQRISLRRHARLVDYLIHEGCNARAWVALHTSIDRSIDPREIYFITPSPENDIAGGGTLTADDLRNIPTENYEVFEPLLEHPADPIQLFHAHNRIEIYTWGDAGCCLPKGATSCTLKDWNRDTVKVVERGEEAGGGYVFDSKRPERTLHLKVGDVLIFEETIGPKTGNHADADPRHRQAVRLTRVEQGLDELYNRPVVEIAWDDADALAFPLCISAIGPAEDGCELLENITIARGNVLLVDHGATQPPEYLGAVPLETSQAVCDGIGSLTEIALTSGIFRPRLAGAPITFSSPLKPMLPASRALLQSPAGALPRIDLRAIPGAPDGSQPLYNYADIADPRALLTDLINHDDPVAAALRGLLAVGTRALLEEYREAGGTPANALLAALQNDLGKLVRRWRPRPDLLESYGDDADFVTEIDNDGIAHLRFGDGELGEEPEAGTGFDAIYRTGNGPAGNVGAESISCLVYRDSAPSGITITARNPMPAGGGTAQESMGDARLNAPHAFRSELRRAITADDYAAIAGRNGNIQRAAGLLRWTGSWYEMEVAVDPRGTDEPMPALLDQVEGAIYPFGRMGYDLNARQGRYVPLDIELTVCVLPHYLRGHVKAALLSTFSNRRGPDG